MIVKPRKEMDSCLEELYMELDSVLEVLETGKSTLRNCYELDLEAKKLSARFEHLQSAFYVYWYAIHFDIAITEDYLQEDYRFQIWQAGFRNFAYMDAEGLKLWSDANLSEDRHIKKESHPNEYGLQVPNETNYLFKYKITAQIHNTLDWLALLDKNLAVAEKACNDDACKEQYFYHEIDDYPDISRFAKKAEQKELLHVFIKEVAEGGRHLAQYFEETETDIYPKQEITVEPLNTKKLLTGRNNNDSERTQVTNSQITSSVGCRQVLSPSMPKIKLAIETLDKEGVLIYGVQWWAIYQVLILPEYNFPKNRNDFCNSIAQLEIQSRTKCVYNNWRNFCPEKLHRCTPECWHNLDNVTGREKGQCKVGVRLLELLKQ